MSVLAVLASIKIWKYKKASPITHARFNLIGCVTRCSLSLNVSNLVPEQPIVVSPTLAATIGLAEAVMLQSLAELIKHRGQQRATDSSLRWLLLADDELTGLFPFWSFAECQQTRSSLENLGVIRLERAQSAQGAQEKAASWIAIDEQPVSSPVLTSSAAKTSQPATQSATQPRQQAQPAGMPVSDRPSIQSNPTSNQGIQGTAAIPESRNSAHLIPVDWQPDANWIRLAKQHAIPDEFIHSLVPEFVSYWRDRGQARFSWGNAFYKHVLKEWRHEQTRKGAHELASTMSPQWQPSLDALEILENAGISGSFIEDAIAEFVLYWRERGVVHGAWNTKFIEHIRRQWAKYTASFGRDDTPRPILDGWQPSADCFEILQLAEIDEEYARSKVPEFVMYWKDSGQAKASWNTVFLQFIKQDWARRLKQVGNDETTYGEDQTLTGSNQQKIREKFERIADRSWAD